MITLDGGFGCSLQCCFSINMGVDTCRFMDNSVLQLNFLMSDLSPDMQNGVLVQMIEFLTEFFDDSSLLLHQTSRMVHLLV